MKLRRHFIHSLILGLAIAGTAMSQPTFTIAQLPNTPNYTIVAVLADGRMFGNTTDPATGISSCAEYQNGAWSAFSTPGYSCTISAVNKSGQFVGTFQGPSVSSVVDGITITMAPPEYPFANFDGTFTALQPPGLTYGQNSATLSTFGRAVSIADNGAVVGFVTTNSTTGTQQTAWVYSGGQYRTPSAATAPWSQGSAINNNGVAAGIATFGPFITTPQHPAIFNTDGSVQDLGTLGGTSGYAYAINTKGQVTGCANTSGLYQVSNPVYQSGGGSGPGPALQTCQAFFYDGKSMQQIQIPGANWASQGSSINDAGDVLGNYTNDFNDAASQNFLNSDGVFYYHAGTMYRLDTTTIQNFPAAGISQAASFVEGTNQIVLWLALPNGNPCQANVYSAQRCYTTQVYLLTPASTTTAQPAITAVVNGASFTAPISSGSWITIQGGSLSTITRSWNSSDFSGNNLPTQLDGVSVTVNGVAAYPYYISPTQLNVLAPDGVVAGPVQVQVTNPQGTSNVFTVNAGAATPAFFVDGTKYVAAQHANGGAVGPAAQVSGGDFTPALPGETIQLFGTGFGPMNPFSPAGQTLAAAAPLANTVTVTIGGQPAVVMYAGVVGNGLDQLNVVVPQGLPNGDASIVATVNGVSTQSGLTITVQQ